MAYSTRTQVRAEDLTVAEASDVRVDALITQADTFIDNVTGSWFESRAAQTITLDGPDTNQLLLAVPIIAITGITEHDRVSATSTTIATTDYYAYTDVDYPRIRRLNGDWGDGPAQYEVAGTFGHLEDSATPLDITRASIMLVRRWALGLGDPDGTWDRRMPDASSFTTRGRTTNWSGWSSDTAISGDKEIDRILLRYRRPPIGALV